eukprot:m.1058973 g.1058973  ORF g.1058973 m.1058973 type:complete len:160 (+) comp24208_c0_seq22:3266-3745(+)
MVLRLDTHGAQGPPASHLVVSCRCPRRLLRDDTPTRVDSAHQHSAPHNSNRDLALRDHPRQTCTKRQTTDCAPLRHTPTALTTIGEHAVHSVVHRTRASSQRAASAMPCHVYPSVFDDVTPNRSFATSALLCASLVNSLLEVGLNVCRVDSSCMSTSSS